MKKIILTQILLFSLVISACGDKDKEGGDDNANEGKNSDNIESSENHSAPDEDAAPATYDIASANITQDCKDVLEDYRLFLIELDKTTQEMNADKENRDLQDKYFEMIEENNAKGHDELMVECSNVDEFFELMMKVKANPENK